MPRRHETLVASKPTLALALGGKGANQAVAAARLGSAARFMGRLGGDAHGGWLREALRSNGVGDWSSVSSGASGQGMVMLDREGGASSVVVSGANGEPGRSFGGGFHWK